MRLFITGATGFIGSHLLAALGAQGDIATALRRRGSCPRLAATPEPAWLEKPLDALEASDLEGHDAIVHLASAGVSPQKASWADMLHWNVAVVERLLAAAAQAKVRRVVLAGSFAEYGRAADRYDFIPPDAPLEPTSAYAASKAAAFMVACAMAAQHGLEVCYLRVFSAYGEGQHEANFFPSLRRAALGGLDFPMTPGEQVRDFIPVEAVARQFLTATRRQDVTPGVPRVVNVGSGVPTRIADFAQARWREWGARGRLQVGAVPYRTAEPMRFVAQTTDTVTEAN